MPPFLVTFETQPGDGLTSIIRQLGGTELTSTTWIIPWKDTADALCLRLRPFSPAVIVASSTANDWSYR